MTERYPPESMKITDSRLPKRRVSSTRWSPSRWRFSPASSLRPRRSAATGDLTYVGCIANFGANGCEQPVHDSLREPVAVAVSRDDKSVYVGSGRAVTWFKRRSSGALVLQGVHHAWAHPWMREAGHGSLNYGRGPRR